MFKSPDQMTQEDLQAMIQDLQMMISKANENDAEKKYKIKGSFANCTARFSGLSSHEAVETFIATIETYKEVENISDEDALKGLSLLFHEFASTWWQGIRKEAKNWTDALALIREHFSPKKLPHQIYTEFFDKKQSDTTSMVQFVVQQRALLAQFTDGRHNENIEIDMIYGQLNIKYRKQIPRNEIGTFKELLDKARIIEQNEIEEEATQSGSSKRIKRCTHCNYRGHLINECRKRKQEKEKVAENEDNDLRPRFKPA